MELNKRTVYFSQMLRFPRAVAGLLVIAAALLTYLDVRFEHRFRGLTRTEVARTLQGLNVEPHHIDALIGELEAADFARFAGSGDAKDLRVAIERAQKVVESIEGGLG